jgi:hypothetical protein
MVSVYAVIRSLGLPAPIASTAQILIAILALGMVVLATRRFSPRQALGVTAIATLLISPYAYDYDLSILGIGLGLLLADLVSLGTDRERLALYASSLFIGIFSIVQTVIASKTDPDKVIGESIHLSLGGLAVVVILALTWHILLRGQERRAGSIEVSVKTPTYAHANASPAATLT